MTATCYVVYMAQIDCSWAPMQFNLLAGSCRAAGGRRAGRVGLVGRRGGEKITRRDCMQFNLLAPT